MKSLSSEKTGQIEMILAMSLAGSSVVAGKALTGDYPVFFIGTVTMLFSIVLLIPLQFFNHWELCRIPKGEWRWMMLQALFGIVLFRIFSLLGMRYTSGFTTGVVTSAGPAVFALTAFLIFREKLSPGAAFSILLTSLGILWIQLSGKGGTGGSNPPLGIALVLLAVVSEVFLTVFRKTSSGRLSSTANTLALCLVAFLFFLVPQLISGDWPDLQQIPRKDWLILLFYGWGGTVVAYILWGDGALKITTVQTGLITACMPLSAMFLSILLLGEHPGWKQWLGASLVILGLGGAMLPARRDCIPEKEKQARAERLDKRRP